MNDKNLPNRKSIRLSGWDYASSGAYFLTLHAARGSAGNMQRTGELQFAPASAGADAATPAPQFAPASARTGADAAAPAPQFAPARMGGDGIFGYIIDGCMHLNEFGLIAHNAWMQTPIIRPNMSIDEFVVMPDHFHAILIINAKSASASDVVSGFKSPAQTVGAVVRGFKSAVTAEINKIRQCQGYPVWQRNYYERIIKDEYQYDRIRAYIKQNPVRWNRKRKI
jgi:REP element-mobilizing transposase RayT